MLASFGSCLSSTTLVQAVTCANRSTYLAHHTCLQVEERSYHEIALTLGQDSPADILFVTDNIAEARAAASAGWRVLVADRPGNKPLPADHGFRVVTTMNDVLPRC